MGRKRRFSRLLLFAAMLSTIGAGVLGSVPLPVKAAEEEGTYTVRFEAYEGTCETESVSVPRGESITLPGASYEGHYLESWMDVTESGNVHTFKAVGAAGSEYTPERDLWLYANWKLDQEPGQDITVTYEARIGDTGYEELEEAFADAQAGDTITVLKDCRVSGTLEVTADNITLKSEDAGNPVTISREEGFSGKYYGTNTDTVLLAVPHRISFLMEAQYWIVISIIPAKPGTAPSSTWMVLMPWRAELSFRIITTLTDMRAMAAADRSTQPGHYISKVAAALPWMAALYGTAIHPAAVAASSRKQDPMWKLHPAQSQTVMQHGAAEWNSGEAQNSPT